MGHEKIDEAVIVIVGDGHAHTEPLVLLKWGMHLTPEAPRSSIRALEDHSRTLGEFQERFAFRFQIQPLPSPRGAQ